MRFCKLAKEIFEAIAQAGGHVYIVGGSVRDEILKQETFHDIDVEVFGLQYDQLRSLLSHFGNVHIFGKSFAIMQLETLPGYDFALPRKESKIGQRHQDFDIIVDPYLSLEDAIARRDLTMNALMYDYQNQCIIDLCGGQKDIENGLIRCVNPQTFVEDPLRVLRVASFVSRFQMKVEKQTYMLCKQMVKDGMLQYLSKERIFQEYNKILMSQHPSLGFEFLKSIQALPSYLHALTTTHQRLDYHPEGDVFNHTMLVIDIAALMKHKVDCPLEFMWSCLFHDIGKPQVTTPDGHAYGHQEAGVAVFKNIDLPFSKKQRSYISAMICYHMQLMNMARNQASDLQYLRFLKKIEGRVSLNDLIWISCCDKLGRGKVSYEQYDAFWKFMHDKLLRLDDHAIKPIIDGKTLIKNGIKPSSHFQDILDEAYDLQLQGYHQEKIIRSLKKKYE